MQKYGFKIRKCEINNIENSNIFRWTVYSIKFLGFKFIRLYLLIAF